MQKITQRYLDIQIRQSYKALSHGVSCCDEGKFMYNYVITPFGVVLLVYPPDTRGPEGEGG